VSDAQWLQRLHSYGLLRASFRPKGEIVELRAYLRQRERLLEHRSLAYPAYAEGHDGDESSASSRRFRHHRGDRHAHHPRDHRGERDPAVLASMRDTRCHSSAEVIEKALTGHYRAGICLSWSKRWRSTMCISRSRRLRHPDRVCSQGTHSIRGRKEDARADGSGSPRRRSRQSNGPDFDVGKALHSLLGKDLTRIHGWTLSRAQARVRMRR